MNHRALARTFVEGVAAAALGFVERRIDWRRANAHELELEARRMVHLLERDPHRVPFRNARIGHWRRRERRFAAMAWAQNEAKAIAFERLATARGCT